MSHRSQQHGDDIDDGENCNPRNTRYQTRSTRERQQQQADEN